MLTQSLFFKPACNGHGWRLSVGPNSSYFVLPFCVEQLFFLILLWTSHSLSLSLFSVSILNRFSWLPLYHFFLLFINLSVFLFQHYLLLLYTFMLITYFCFWLSHTIKIHVRQMIIIPAVKK